MLQQARTFEIPEEQPPVLESFGGGEIRHRRQTR
jgi:hypothetical protein